MIRIPALWLIIAAGILWAQEPAGAPAKPDVKSDLTVLETAYKADLDDVAADHEKWAAALKNWYLAGLDKLRAERIKDGDLEGVLAFKAERERIVAGVETTREQVQAMPEKLGKLRAAYDLALKKINDEVARRKDAARSKFLANLEERQKRLTVSGDLDAALLVKTEKERFAAETAGVTPALASADQPFRNSLGMKFVPVAIRGGPTSQQRVLFSVWDTRVQDYEPFVKETGTQWPQAEFPQDPTHPAVNVSWEDAQLFCQWLTTRDHAAGLLSAKWRYRLPSDHEWSCAVGLQDKEDLEKLPSEKSGKIADEYPWGGGWPPPKGAGNYAGEELKPAVAAGTYAYGRDMVAGYADDFVYTSPVGSFAANRFGLFDMGGNVWQWCGDWFDAEHKERALRGASWRTSARPYLLSSVRMRGAPDARIMNYGFRCVLAASGD
jgi:formylglycine-generating enzyme required for sulfatase activity